MPRVAIALGLVAFVLLAWADAKPAKDDAFAYRLQKGQTFAYRFDMRWDAGDKIEGFTGTPVYEVKVINEKGNSELMVVGRLRGWWKPKDSDQAKYYEGREIWLGTRLVLDKLADRTFGRADRGLKLLPYRMHMFIGPTGMIFPELPPTIGFRVGHDRDAQFMEQRFGGGPFKLGPELSTTPGRQFNWREARQEASGIVNVSNQEGFHTTKGPKLSWAYQADTKFDTSRGLPISLDASFETEGSGVKPPPVRITARLLEGDALKEAVAAGKEDWKLIPGDLKPIEFLRQAIELRLPKHVKSSADLKQGQVYAYLGPEYRYWLVEPIAVLDKYEIRIRYKGSKEEVKCKAVELAIIPPDKLPK